MILFYTSKSMLLEITESEKVLANFQEAQKLAQLGCSQLDSSVRDTISFDFHQFFHALTQMKNLFGTCKIQSDNNDGAVPRTLEINLTETEETWIKQRFSQIQDQFVSVVPNADFMQEACDLLGKGIPVSRRFSPQWMLIVTERVRRVLKIHPEFCKLPDECQEMLWRKNRMHAAVIAVARINSVRTGFLCHYHNLLIHWFIIE
jgi:hypothetical protein